MMRLSDLYEDKEKINIKGDSFFIRPSMKSPYLHRKIKINILALGDVGGMLLMGLRLLGGETISSIGIYDLNEDISKRYEIEANQIQLPFEYNRLPVVERISGEKLFHCDVMIFCASRGVPPVSEKNVDVRMAQLEANAQLVEKVSRQGRENKFKGIFAIMSDPVDPLCKAALMQGLEAEQIQGFGLGVMNARAIYFGEKEKSFERYIQDGRVFGPHGRTLVVADSINAYNHELSLALTKLVVHANEEVRDLGFKPYMAPALSSGALSILAMIQGQWNYSSVYFGKGKEGAFLGEKNRRTPYGIEVENLPLPDELYERIQQAYLELKKLR